MAGETPAKAGGRALRMGMRTRATHTHARQMHLWSLLPSPFKEGPGLGLIARLQACTWASTYEERMPCSFG